jgi:hypothetical protein
MPAALDERLNGIIGAAPLLVAGDAAQRAAAICRSARIRWWRRVLHPMRPEFCKPLSAAGRCRRRVRRCHSTFVLQTSPFRNGADELADEPPSRANILLHGRPVALLASRVLPEDPWDPRRSSRY